MDKDYLIQKWLARELTPEEEKAFESLEDVAFLKGIADDAKNFRASQFSKAKTYEEFKETLDAHRRPVKKLNWVRPLMRVASIFIVGLAGYYFFQIQLKQLSIHSYATLT